MHTRLGLCVAALLVMTACRTELTVTARPSASKATSSPAATGASVKPIPVASAAAAHLRLQAPADGGTPLAGKLMIDASYLVASGAGNVLTRPEGQVALVSQGLLSQDGGGLISQDGGGLISQDGGGLVAQGAGNLVAQGAGNLVASEAGGKVVASQGSVALVAQGAGNLISQDGGGLVAQGAGNYRLQAAATPPAAGTQLPAAGMLVSVVDLGTNQYLPLGRDAKGHPVFTVYSDTAGGYQVYLPKGHSTQVMVVASSPATRDSRLTYNLITAPTPQVAGLDEASSLAALALRSVGARHLETYTRQAQGAQPPCKNAVGPEAMALDAATQGFLTRLVTAVTQTKLYDQPIERQDAIASFMEDFVVAGVGDPTQVHTSSIYPGFVPEGAEADESALAFQAQLLQQLNQRAAEMMAKPADALRLERQLRRFRERIAANANASFGNQLAVRLDGTCNIPLAVPPVPTLRKPSDVASFLVDALLGDGDAFRNKFVVELFEIMDIAPGSGAVKDPDLAADDALEALMSQKTSVAERPAVRIYYHLLAASSGFFLKLPEVLQNPDTQCRMLHEIQADAACPPPSAP